MAWGSTLAVWVVAVSTIGTSRAMGINTMDDFNSVLSTKLEPVSNYLKSSVGRQWVGPGTYCLPRQ